MLTSQEVLNGNFPSSRRFSLTHNGIDFPCPLGTVVKSRYAGVVKVTGTNGGFETDTNPTTGSDFGNYIRVYHPQLKQSTWYAHLKDFTCTPGQIVPAGFAIAHSSNTGFVQGITGFHLHFSQSVGETTMWIDPDTIQTGGDPDVDNYQLINSLMNRFQNRNATSDEAGNAIKSGDIVGYAFANWKPDVRYEIANNIMQVLQGRNATSDETGAAINSGNLAQWAKDHWVLASDTDAQKKLDEIKVILG